MDPQRQVLMVVTSHDHITPDHPTGLWLEEFAIPYQLFRRAGLEVTVASPRGGATPIDPNSNPTPEQEQEWAEAREALKETLPVDDVGALAHGAVFLPGGHGTMFDLPTNTRLRTILGQMAAAGRVIAAVCHGPAGLVSLRNEDGSPWVAGKRLTAFTDEEEREVQLAAAMPFLLETRLRELGANVVTAPNWTDHTEVDGNLVTGQNPQSSRSSAEAVLRLMGAGELRKAA